MSTNMGITQIWLPGCWGTGYVRCPLGDAMGTIEEIEQHTKDHHPQMNFILPRFDLEEAMILLADQFNQYLYRTKFDDQDRKGWVINNEYGSSRAGSPATTSYPTVRAAAYSALAGIRDAARAKRENLTRESAGIEQHIELLNNALAPV